MASAAKPAADSAAGMPAFSTCGLDSLAAACETEAGGTVTPHDEAVGADLEVEEDLAAATLAAGRASLLHAGGPTPGQDAWLPGGVGGDPSMEHNDVGWPAAPDQHLKPASAARGGGSKGGARQPPAAAKPAAGQHAEGGPPHRTAAPRQPQPASQPALEGEDDEEGVREAAAGPRGAAAAALGPEEAGLLHAETAGRRPLSSLTHAEFDADLAAFWEARGDAQLAGLVRGQRIACNSVPLDMHGLYREVVRHGGFLANERYDNKGSRWMGTINFSRDVFPKLRNWTPNHRVTSVGTQLLTNYRRFLLPYERAYARWDLPSSALATRQRLAAVAAAAAAGGDAAARARAVAAATLAAAPAATPAAQGDAPDLLSQLTAATAGNAAAPSAPSIQLPGPGAATGGAAPATAAAPAPAPAGAAAAPPFPGTGALPAPPSANATGPAGAVAGPADGGSTSHAATQHLTSALSGPGAARNRGDGQAQAHLAAAATGAAHAAHPPGAVPAPPRRGSCPGALLGDAARPGTGHTARAQTHDAAGAPDGATAALQALLEGADGALEQLGVAEPAAKRRRHTVHGEPHAAACPREGLGPAASAVGAHAGDAGVGAARGEAAAEGGAAAAAAAAGGVPAALAAGERVSGVRRVVELQRAWARSQGALAGSGQAVPAPGQLLLVLDPEVWQAPPAAAQQQQQRRRQDGGPRAPGRAHPPQHPAPAAAARHGAGGGTGALSGQQDGAAVEEEARRPLLWVVMVADLCDLPVEVAEGGRVLPDGDAVGSAPWGGPAATALPLTLSEASPAGRLEDAVPVLVLGTKALGWVPRAACHWATGPALAAAMATAWARLQALGGPSHHPHYAALSPGGGPAPEVACMRGLRAAVELMAGEAAAAAAFRGGGAGAHAAALAARSMVQGVCVAHAARRLLRLEALLGPAALATPSHAYWQAWRHQVSSADTPARLSHAVLALVHQVPGSFLAAAAAPLWADVLALMALTPPAEPRPAASATSAAGAHPPSAATRGGGSGGGDEVALGGVGGQGAGAGVAEGALGGGGGGGEAGAGGVMRGGGGGGAALGLPVIVSGPGGEPSCLGVDMAVGVLHASISWAAVEAAWACTVSAWGGVGGGGAFGVGGGAAWGEWAAPGGATGAVGGGAAAGGWGGGEGGMGGAVAAAVDVWGVGGGLRVVGGGWAAPEMMGPQVPAPKGREGVREGGLTTPSESTATAVVVGEGFPWAP